MPARIRHVTIDCRDPSTLAPFWAEMLGFVGDTRKSDEPGAREILLADPTGRHPGLLFIAVPEPKTIKNRIHLDLLPSAERDVTVDRAIDLGASLVADRRRPDGTGWVVLADPEGNELCVERSGAERGEASAGPGADEDFPEIHASGEVEMLIGVLEWYREAVRRKVIGLSERHAHMSPVASGTTIAGLLKHLALVEDSWFEDRFGGAGEPEPWSSADWDADPDWEFHSAADDTIAQLLTLYDAACARSRRAAEGHGLDDLAADPGRRAFNLRFAHLHLIDETARHLGHMDILREFFDGQTGE